MLGELTRTDDRWKLRAPWDQAPVSGSIDRLTRFPTRRSHGRSARGHAHHVDHPSPHQPPAAPPGRETRPPPPPRTAERTEGTPLGTVTRSTTAVLEPTEAATPPARPRTRRTESHRGPATPPPPLLALLCALTVLLGGFAGLARGSRGLRSEPARSNTALTDTRPHQRGQRTGGQGRQPALLLRPRRPRHPRRRGQELPDAARPSTAPRPARRRPRAGRRAEGGDHNDGAREQRGRTHRRRPAPGVLSTPTRAASPPPGRSPRQTESQAERGARRASAAPPTAADVVHRDGRWRLRPSTSSAAEHARPTTARAPPRPCHPPPDRQTGGRPYPYTVPDACTAGGPARDCTQPIPSVGGHGGPHRVPFPSQPGLREEDTHAG